MTYEDHLFHYRALAVKPVDGDSVWLELDLGLRMYHKANCRLAGINAPEIFGLSEEERQAGYDARDFLWNLIAGEDLIVRSEKLDKYGRPIVTIFVETEYGWLNVNERMIEEGQAVRYK